jgi:hypothetical protein
MSSPKFKAPLRITPEHSRLLTALLVGMHLAALMMLLFLPLARPLLAASGLLIAFSLYSTLCSHVFGPGKRAVKSLVWQPSGRMFIEDGQGEVQRVIAADDSLVHPLAIVLNLTLDDRSKRALVLLPDSAPAGVLRDLRKRLRITVRNRSDI